MNVFKKNTPNWKISELEEEIQNFSKIYKRRPIKENIHGMRFQHMLITYFILKKIKYRNIIRAKTIIPQILKFLKNSLFFKFDFIKPGRIRINTNIKAIDGIISSKPIS